MNADEQLKGCEEIKVLLNTKDLNRNSVPISHFFYKIKDMVQTSDVDIWKGTCINAINRVIDKLNKT